MKNHSRIAARIDELRAIIAAYGRMTVDEAEQSDAGDREIEAEAELWRLEQDLLERGPETHRVRAA